MTNRGSVVARLLRGAVAALVALACLVAARAAEAAPTKVFVLAGQSNMVGFGKVPEYSANWPSEFPNIKLYSALEGGPLSGPTTLKLGNSGLGADQYGPAKFGPELGIAEQLSQRFSGEQMVFIKIAWGGTSLGGDWLGSAGCDQLASNPNLTNTKCVYPWFADRLSAALGSMQNYEIWGVFWMQGEADASFADLAGPGVYQRHLETFVNSNLRPLLPPDHAHQVAGFVPFVFGQIRNTWPYSGRITADQRQAQFSIAAARCTEGPSLASTYTLRPSGNDPFNWRHYDAAGAQRTGRELGKAFVDLLAGRTTPGCPPPVDVTGLWQSLID